MKPSFDQINPFTGMNNISIPIYEIREGDVVVPISLTYTSGGVQVDDEPGPFGLSWELMAGGAIKRKVNNIPDESCGGMLMGPDGYAGYYLDHEEEIWVSSTQIYSTYNSGYFFNTTNPPGTTMYVSKDNNPDEFFFNINNISGSFFMGADGIWKVKADPGISLKISSTFGSLTDLFVTVKEFRITDQNGFVYTFGGDESCIERAKNTILYSPFLMSYGTYVSDFNNQSVAGQPDLRERIESFPNTWRIKQIQSPAGSIITFNYVQHGVRGKENKMYVKNIYTSGLGDEIRSGSDISPSFLTSIETVNQRIVFTKSISNGYYQKYNQRVDPAYNNDGYYKFDAVEIFTKNPSESVKRFGFKYIETPTERLKLKAITLEESGLADEQVVFTYDPLLLQNYVSNTDHWGFNNTKSRVPVYMEQEYFNSKEPDINVLQAEVLTSVRTPFGGKVSFFYEPNAFSKVAKQNPFIINSYSGFGGGIRIKKVVTDPLIGPRMEKEYFYVDEGFNGQGTSSGVLSGIPRYSFIEEGNKVSYQSTMVNTPSQTFGRDVTYSRVVEKDNTGFKVYHYNNLDNGYMDVAGEPLFRSFNTDLIPYTSKELLRGKIFKLEYYTSEPNQVLVYQQENRYNEEYNITLPASGFGPNPGLSSTAEISPYANFVNYTFTPYLSRRIETTISAAGPITTERNYTYNAKNLLVSEWTLNSAKKLVEIKYKYPSDMVAQGEDPLFVYANMMQSNIIAPVIEKTEILDGQVTSLIRTNYDRFNNMLFLPKSIDIQIGGSTFLGKRIFDKYNQLGNLLQERNDVGISKSYLWSYGSKYPIAEISNVSYSTLEDIFGGVDALELFSSSSPTDNEAREKINLLRKSPLLKDSQIKSFTYKPLTGVSSATDEKGMTVFYEHDTLQRLKLIRNDEGSIIKQFHYQYKSR